MDSKQARTIHVAADTTSDPEKMTTTFWESEEPSQIDNASMPSAALDTPQPEQATITTTTTQATLRTSELTATCILPSTYVAGFHDPVVVKRMRYRKLGDCVDKSGAPMWVSILGLGTSSLGNVFGEVDRVEAVGVVVESIKAGINFIDTAPWYGHGLAESVLGEALQQVPREAYYIFTKAGRYEKDILNMFDFSRERTWRSIDESLQRLGCGYLDCVQVHDPEFALDMDAIARDVLGTIDDARQQGKTRMVGITGFPLDIHKRLIIAAEKANIKVHTAISYCHLTLQNDTLLTDLLPFLDEHKVAVINAAPVMMGVLSSSAPPPWNPASEAIKTAAATAARYCDEHGIELADLAVHFSLTHQRIPTTVVSATSVDILRKNLGRVYALRGNNSSSSDCSGSASNSNCGGSVSNGGDLMAAGSLCEHEAEVMRHVVDTCLLPVHNLSWEGVQVQMYHDMLSKAKQGHDTGTLDTT